MEAEPLWLDPRPRWLRMAVPSAVSAPAPTASDGLAPAAEAVPLTRGGPTEVPVRLGLFHCYLSEFRSPEEHACFGSV